MLKKLFFVFLCISLIAVCSAEYVDYFDLSGNDEPYGIVVDGDYLFVVDKTDTGFFKYWLNGTYTGEYFNISSSGNTNPRGAFIYDDFIWIANLGDTCVYKYWLNGTYTNTKLNLSTQIHFGSLSGVASDGTYLWATDTWDSYLRKYWLNGTYISYTDISSNIATTAYGLTTNGTYVWVSGYSEGIVFKYFANGTYTGDEYNTSEDGPLGQPSGITQNGTYFWMVSKVYDAVWVFDMDWNYLGSITEEDVYSGGGSSTDPFTPVIGGVSKILNDYNPQAYPVLVQRWDLWLNGNDLNSFFSNFLNLFVVFLQYVFKQPASLAGGGF